MQTGVWNKTDLILKPYIDAQAELYELENIIFRLDKIIPPGNLRTKIILTAHKQGYLGLSKTKEMIRHKYWWPGMNLQIEESVKRCFECQIATNAKHTEPAKMTELPARPWTAVEIDLCEALPNGKYAPRGYRPVLQVPRNRIYHHYILRRHQKEAKENLLDTRHPPNTPNRQWTTI